MTSHTLQRGAPALALAYLLSLGACGGGGGGGSTPPVTVPPPTGPNVAPLLVDAGPLGLSFNLPSVKIKICTPNTTQCTSVDHVLVDTGSTGLRVFSSVLPNAAALPQVNTTSGGTLSECAIFADGYTWGTVRNADVQLADGQGSNIEIQIMDDSTAVSTAPAECKLAGPSLNSPGLFGANGVLGVAVFKEDCPACEANPLPGNLGAYYGCSGGVCTPVTVALGGQVQNPVYQFSTNNNGLAIQLPKVAAAGEPGTNGYLILGIDTQSNNQLGTATVLTLDPTFGNFTTTYKGTALARSFIDSGSNGFFFDDTSLPACKTNTGFYCPASATNLSATNQGVNGVNSSVSFTVVDTDTVFSVNPTFSAYQNIAGTNPLKSSFDWGLPFFYGRRVSIAFEGRTTSAGAGPFVAY